MGEHYRARRISETILRYRPAVLPNGKHGVRDIETGKIVDAPDCDTEDLARVRCRMVAAADIEALYVPDRATAVARVAAIIGAQSDPVWAAQLICDFFEGCKA